MNIYVNCPCGKPHDQQDIEIAAANGAPLVALDPSWSPPPRVRLYCCANCASLYAEAEPGMPGRAHRGS